MKNKLYLLLLCICFSVSNSYAQSEYEDYHWSIKLKGLFGQTTGPNFTANGAAIAVAYYFNISSKSKILLEHSAADLRGASFLVTDMEGNTIGRGRQAFYKLQFKSLFQQSIWSNTSGTNVFIALGPGLSYVYENTFSEIGEIEIEGPIYKEHAVSANAELGIEMDRFIFSVSFTKSYYDETSVIIDASNWYLGLTAGYRF